MEFLIIGKDGTDAQAPARRLAARPGHLESIKSLKEAGKLLHGGALLDDSGNMIGSLLIGEFESEDEIREQWLVNEPYIRSNVWQEVEIRPFSVAGVFK